MRRGDDGGMRSRRSGERPHQLPHPGTRRPAYLGERVLELLLEAVAERPHVRRECVELQQRQLGGASEAREQKDVLRARPPPALLAAPEQQVGDASGSPPEGLHTRGWVCGWMGDGGRVGSVCRTVDKQGPE